MLAFISDIHIGKKVPKIDYLQSLDLVFDTIKKQKEPCDGIFICGDLFDHRLTIEEYKFATVFLIHLVCNQCGHDGHTHAPVRIIHGTYSHDYHQMDIFLPMLQRIDNVDVQYFDTATSGTLPNGMKVLYLPQEYGNIDYTKAFDDQYDIIVGHGPIASSVKSPCPISKNDIMLPVETLGSISKICVFGHYHVYTEFENNVFYTGSLLRFQYGEPEPKAFLICDNQFNITKVVNPFAIEYVIKDVYSPDELRSYLSEEISNPHRFMIHTDNSDLSIYHAIMNAHKQNQFISYRIISEKNETDEETKEVVIRPTTIEQPIPSLIHYISDKYDIDVSEQLHAYESEINKDTKSQ